MISWFETHAHLSDPKFELDQTEVIERAFQQGIETIIEIADGPSEWKKAQLLAEKNKGKIWWAAGIHPYFADQGSEENFEQLKSFAFHSQFVALGEVGLDYAKCPIAPEVQKKTFEKALMLSREINKPLIIHCREAFADLIPIVQTFFKKNSSFQPGVIHCFTGTWEEAQPLLELGFYLGADAPITYPKAQPLRDVFTQCPLDRIVIETDSPYLPPQDFRGKRNEPAHLLYVARKLAELKGVSLEIIAEQLLVNSRRLFRLS